MVSQQTSLIWPVLETCLRYQITHQHPELLPLSGQPVGFLLMHCNYLHLQQPACHQEHINPNYRYRLSDQSRFIPISLIDTANRSKRIPGVGWKYALERWDRKEVRLSLENLLMFEVKYLYGVGYKNKKLIERCNFIHSAVAFGPY